VPPGVLRLLDPHTVQWRLPPHATPEQALDALKELLASPRAAN
jgi:hypothetical protein